MTVDAFGSSKSSRGTAMVEFAIILPVFTFLLFGFIQWGLIFGAGLTLRNATASAARYSVVNNLSAGSTAVATYVFNAVQPLLNNSAFLNVTLTTGGSGDIKQVDASYNLPLILPFVVPGSSGGSFLLTARAVMQ